MVLQTILLVPVACYGVVQLGSLETVGSFDLVISVYDCSQIFGSSDLVFIFSICLQFLEILDVNH